MATTNTNVDVMEKKRHIDSGNYEIYIHRILKEVQPNLSISKQVLHEVNKLLVEVHRKIVKVADGIAI